jgi:hypothetical protein
MLSDEDDSPQDLEGCTGRKGAFCCSLGERWMALHRRDVRNVLQSCCRARGRLA